MRLTIGETRPVLRGGRSHRTGRRGGAASIGTPRRSRRIGALTGLAYRVARAPGRQNCRTRICAGARRTIRRSRIHAYLSTVVTRLCPIAEVRPGGLRIMLASGCRTVVDEVFDDGGRRFGAASRWR
jgi:hypothetical protein